MDSDASQDRSRKRPPEQETKRPARQYQSSWPTLLRPLWQDQQLQVQPQRVHSSWQISLSSVVIAKDYQPLAEPFMNVSVGQRSLMFLPRFCVLFAPLVRKQVVLPRRVFKSGFKTLKLDLSEFKCAADAFGRLAQTEMPFALSRSMNDAVKATRNEIVATT
jgi:hypothetical protein